jgi:RNA polymerase subunit RPABC4/transcription elongation factor Spt4
MSILGYATSMIVIYLIISIVWNLIRGTEDAYDGRQTDLANAAIKEAEYKKSIRQCPYCLAEDVPAQASKCKYCSSELTPKVSDSVETYSRPAMKENMIACPSCGYNVSKNARKCNVCGSLLTSTAWGR